MGLYIFGFGLIVSQFYVLRSGLPQPSHFLLALPALVFFLQGKSFKLSSYGNNAPVALVFFFFYSTFVNLSYAIYLESPQFIFPIIYMLYGLCVFLILQNLVLYRHGAVKVFCSFLFSGLLLLFLFSLFGIGRFDFFPRYNAFFNDPNQMAFWALCVSSMLLAPRSVNNLLKLVVALILFYLIVKSASRSGLLGFSILLFGFVFSSFGSKGESVSFKKVLTASLSVALLLCLGFFMIISNVETVGYLEGRVGEVVVGDQAEIRGYTRLLEFPEYLLFGAGHGVESRFSSTGHEIHSTWAALLFYYGVFGMAMVLFFLYLVFRKLSVAQMMIFGAPLLYSTSTLGYRTPIFWIFLSFFYCLTVLEARESKLNRPMHTSSPSV